MTSRVIIAREASAELDESALHLAKEGSIDVALRFYAQADATFESLLSSPFIGRRRAFKSPQLKDVRTWPVNGFTDWLIFYVPDSTGIHVLHVLHGARQLASLLGEEAD